MARTEGAKDKTARKPRGKETEDQKAARMQRKTDQTDMRKTLWNWIGPRKPKSGQQEREPEPPAVAAADLASDVNGGADEDEALQMALALSVVDQTPVDGNDKAVEASSEQTQESQGFTKLDANESEAATDADDEANKSGGLGEGDACDGNDDDNADDEDIAAEGSGVCCSGGKVTDGKAHDDGDLDRTEYTPAPLGRMPSFEELAAELDDSTMTAAEEAAMLGTGGGPTSATGPYLKALSERLAAETKEKNSKAMDKWLVRYLRDNGWTVTAAAGPSIAQKLKVNDIEAGYYRKVVVWDPPLQFKVMPPCPFGCTDKHPDCVRSIGFRHDKPARRVFEFTGHYFLMSRRFTCLVCKKELDEEKPGKDKGKKRGKGSKDWDEAAEIGVGTGGENQRHATFIGYNTRSMKRMDPGMASWFPATLTHKAALDNGFLDLLRPLFVHGVRPEQVSAIMKELSTKQHHHLMLRREWEMRREQSDGKKLGKPKYERGKLFGDFGDEKKYAGKVLSGRYIAHAYKLHAQSIAEKLALEAKKRGARYFSVDVSYKVPKKLCRVNGKPVYKAIVTGTNEHGEVRLQFSIVTESHDQFVQQFKEMKETFAAFGYELPNIMFTDKPKEDHAFLHRQFPNLKDFEAKMNQQARDSIELEAEIPTSSLDGYDAPMVFDKAADFDYYIGTVHDIVKGLPKNERYMGLDCEWCFGQGGRRKIAVLQLAYKHGDSIKCVVGQCYEWANMPKNFADLLRNVNGIKFVGVRVNQDYKFICNDLEMSTYAQSSTDFCVDLASKAYEHGVIQKRNVASLKKLVAILLNEEMAKEPEIRTGNWESKPLPEEMVAYAALDAIKSLEVGYRLFQLPSYTRRLRVKEAIQGTVVDIIPPAGKVDSGSQSLLAVAAVGELMSETQAVPKYPPSIVRKGGKKKPTRLVKVSKLLAPSLVVPGYKIRLASGTFRPACLKDFSSADGSAWIVPVPIAMMKLHQAPGNIKGRLGSAAAGSGPTALKELDPMSGSAAGQDGVSAHLVAGAMEELSKETKLPTEDNKGRERWPPGDSVECSIRASLEESDDDLVAVWKTIAKCKHASTPDLEDLLGKPPAKIRDIFRSVLGDPWHYMDRVKVPWNHTYRKAYYVALREAWFAWDPERLAAAKEALRRAGLSEKRIDEMMYFKVEFFLECVPRVVLPASQLYWRVHKVFAFFGGLLDATTKKPLFNERAWKNAKNLLHEISLGFASDPPGVPMYMERFDREGNAVTNKYGLPLFYSLRGTTSTENHHKQMLQSIGSWPMGVETSDAVRAEHRHRYNHRMSERRRPGFPEIGHYDTWLIDDLQRLVEANHDVLLWPNWSNAHDFLPTSESFGTVPLQSDELTAAVNALQVRRKLSKEKEYLRKQQGVTTLPFLPVTTIEEKAWFKTLVTQHLERKGKQIDFEKMALRWLERVDGDKVFPKLPVYLRTYFEEKKKSWTIEKAVEELGDDLLQLKEWNECLCCPMSPFEATVRAERPVAVHESNSKVVTTVSDSPIAASNDEDDAIKMNGPIVQLARKAGIDGVKGARGSRKWSVAVTRAPEMDKGPRHGLVRPREELPIMQPVPKKARGSDKRPRAPRTCKRCKRFGGANAAECKGRNAGPYGGETKCEHFDERGIPLTR